MTDLIQTVSILAGNSRVERLEDGSVAVQPQLAAFRAGLERAARAAAGPERLGTVAVAFDHRGVFRKQFLASGLTNSQKRNPRLHQLDCKILTLFAPAAEGVEISPEQVLVVHEDTARSYLNFLFQNNLLPDWEKPHIFDPYERYCDVKHKICATPWSGPRLGCAAITWQYYWKASGEAGGSLPQPDDVPDQAGHLLEVFFENDPWCKMEAYEGGVVLAQRLGPRMAIRLNAVSKHGEVFTGKVIIPPRSSSHRRRNS